MRARSYLAHSDCLQDDGSEQNLAPDCPLPSALTQNMPLYATSPNVCSNANKKIKQAVVHMRLPVRSAPSTVRYANYERTARGVQQQKYLRSAFLKPNTLLI